MSAQLQVTGEAKIRDIQGPVVANSGVVTALDGAASQYVRGDGTLADFPTSTGGGSSVSYYLNSSVSQGTIGGVAYRELSKDAITGAGTDITISANGYVASYITDANDPSLLEVPSGNFNCEFYFSVNSDAHNPYVYAELYKYDGATFTLLGSSQAVPEYLTSGTTIAPYYFAIPVATAALAVTDRIAIRIYVNVDGRTVTLHTENNHLCQVVTTFSKGMISLNNLTKQNQYFATGTSGTNFNIVSSADTHTFNLPVASATNTGKLSSTDWTTFNNKLSTATAAATYVPYTGATTNVNLGIYSLTANQIIAGGAGVNNAGTFTTYDGGVATQLIGSTGNLKFFPFWNPTIGARINAEDSAGSAYIPLSFYASNFYFHSNVNFNSTIGNGTYTYTLPSATGTLALTSNLSAYLPLAGGTLTGALSGTSATFSTWVLANDGTRQIYLNPAADFGAGSLPTIQVASNHALQFATNNALRLTIASTGAATFSSSVTANSTISAYYGSITSGNTPATSGTTPVNPMLNLTNNRGIGMYFGGKYSGDYAQWIQVSDVGNLGVNYPLLLNPNGGNVGIGTSSPSAKLHIAGTAANTVSYLSDTTGYALYQIGNSGGGLYYGIDSSTASGFANGAYSRHIYSTGAYPLIISTNDTERMRITSGGVVCVGGTNINPAANATNGIALTNDFLVSINRNNDFGLDIGRNGTDGAVASFRRGSTQVGTISVTGSATAYNTSSDYRLKTDYKNFSGLDLVSKIKAYDYEWKADNTRSYGVLAHELQDILPQAVTGEKDAKEMQGVDYSKIVPVLVKAIQELSSELNELKALIAAK